MKIQVSLIRPNPHRNLEHNPIREEQVVKLVESIGRTGFWDNIVVRPNGAEFQLAYGHNRLEAVRRVGITEIDIPVRTLSDWDMYLCMVDENNTQATITPQIVYENISVGAHLLEQYIRECETAECFLDRIKTVARPPADGRKMYPDDYSRIRNSVLAGEGVGKDLIQQYVPEASRSNSVVSTVLGAIYGESRRKAAEEAAETARKEAADKAAAEELAKKEREAAAEKERAAEAEAKAHREAAHRATQSNAPKEEQARLKREVQKAESKASEAQRQRTQAEKDATRARHEKEKAQAELRKREDEKRAFKQSGVSHETFLKVLPLFSSPKVMEVFFANVKNLRIPESRIVQAAQRCQAEDWSSRSVPDGLFKWWDVESGEAARRYARQEAERKKQAESKKYCQGDLDGFVSKWLSRLDTAMLRNKDILQVMPHASAALRINAVKELKDHVAAITAIMNAAVYAEQQMKDIPGEIVEMLPHYE